MQRDLMSMLASEDGSRPALVRRPASLAVSPQINYDSAQSAGVAQPSVGPTASVPDPAVQLFAPKSSILSL